MSKPRNFTEAMITSIAVRMTYRDREFKAMKARLDKIDAKKQRKRCGFCGDKIFPAHYRGSYCVDCGRQLCNDCFVPKMTDFVCRECYANQELKEDPINEN